MKPRRIATIIFLLSLSASSWAIWMPAKLENLACWSDFIVIGTLRNVREWTRDGMDYGKGDIEVDEVLWGTCQPGTRLKLTWQNRSGLACPRVENAGHANKPGVWLLNAGKPGTVTANYPMRFQPIDQRATIDGILETYRLRIRVDREKKGAVLTVIVRNAGDDPITVPWLSDERGIVLHGTGVQLKVFDGFHAHGGVINPRPHRMDVVPSLRVEVKAHTEVAFETKLSEVYELKPEHDYSVSLEIPGAGPAALDDFWVQP